MKAYATEKKQNRREAQITKRALNRIWTLWMLSLFHSGDRNRLANRITTCGTRREEGRSEESRQERPTANPHCERRVSQRRRARQVLHELFAQVVVDPVNLLLREGLSYDPVQLVAALRVVPEGLLDDYADPPALALVACGWKGDGGGRGSTVLLPRIKSMGFAVSFIV